MQITMKQVRSGFDNALATYADVVAGLGAWVNVQYEDERIIVYMHANLVLEDDRSTLMLWVLRGPWAGSSYNDPNASESIEFRTAGEVQGGLKTLDRLASLNGLARYLMQEIIAATPREEC